MHSNPRAYAGIRVVVGAIVGLLAILPVAIAMAAVMHAVARNYLGQPATIREAYANIRRHWYRYILILLAMYVYSLVPLGALMGIVVAAATLVPAGLARGLVIGLAVILMLAGIVVAFWWMLRWALSVPASLMEDLTVHRALKRSSVLTRGGIGRIFVMLLLVGAVMMMIQYAIQIPTFILLLKNRGAITLTTQIITSLGSSFSGAFVLPIYSIALTLFYYDQRIRKEAYDVEWLMEQAGMRPVGTPPETNPPALPGSLMPQAEPPGAGNLGPAL
jgi:membrane-anchored glycerophosphoryl diester phosphodiesterase (GDPDase)